MLNVFGTEAFTYLLYFGLAIVWGISIKVGSWVFWASSILVVGILTALSLQYFPAFYFAIPVFVITFLLVVFFRTVNELSNRPSMLRESYWNRVALVLLHARAIRMEPVLAD